MTVGYTVHNKEHLIPEIVRGIKKCFEEEDEIIFLFDDCSDNSYNVAKRELFGTSHKLIVPTKELFEIKANNEILKEATYSVIVLFQDDMVCEDLYIRDKVFTIIEKYGPNLGLLGGRDGFELESTSFPEQPVNKVSSWLHKIGGNVLSPGQSEERTYLNRGPIVFTRRLLNTVGYLNEDYFPLWGDDFDYCARCKFKHDLTNVVFQCNIKSPLEWGSTRRKDTNLYKLTKGKHIKKNWNKFIKDWGEYIK